MNFHTWAMPNCAAGSGSREAQTLPEAAVCPMLSCRLPTSPALPEQHS